MPARNRSAKAPDMGMIGSRPELNAVLDTSLEFLSLAELAVVLRQALIAKMSKPDSLNHLGLRDLLKLSDTLLPAKGLGEGQRRMGVIHA